MDKENRVLLYNTLKNAIENEEFLILLQPKFYTKNGDLAGAEALVRWNRNGRLVMPNIFIPIFERYKLITILDMYVLEKACSLLNEWIHKNYKIVPISVNESKQNLYNDNHLNDLIGLINKYNVSPSLIELEMTETTVVYNIDLAKEAEKNVHRLGFIVSMDDFGTGYSSFSMLKNINIDILKMDKSFFDDILESKRGKIIIESIVDMAHKLDTKVVAEGIETQEQVNYLKSINCDMIQGYYFEKTITIEEFERKYLEGNNYDRKK